MCICREDATKEDIIRCPEEEGVINIGSQCVTVQSEKKNYQVCMVHLVLHPDGIAPTFLKLDSWSPGAGFIPIIST